MYVNVFTCLAWVNQERLAIKANYRQERKEPSSKDAGIALDATETTEPCGWQELC